MAPGDAHDDGTPDAAALTPWIAGQRWFANHDPAPRLELLVAWDLPAAEAGVRVRTVLVQDRTPGAEALYQVPLVHRPAGTAADGDQAGAPAVAERDGEVVVDGPRDPAYAAALAALALGGGTVDSGPVRVEGTPILWRGAAPRVTASRVLSGEQSNTSIILDTAPEDAAADGTETGGDAGRGVMVKVFRALHDGENPDVVLQSAIAAAGSTRVPATYGAVVGEWPDPAAPDGRARGHLAVAQEFLAGTEDAWRVALAAARAGTDFTEPARELGAATAEVHRVLAAALPVRDADDAAKAGVLASMRTRAAQAGDVVPDLAGAGDDLAAALAAGLDDAWPPLQRIHGDYHLGQVLRVQGRGWVLLDFEGEPLRPMAERSEPDLPLRDVAGMLRSFDYVAGTIELEGGDAAAARAWADAARSAFLDGWAAGLGTDLAAHRRLLGALELDKALYECVYEARNRPAWLPIPERAVRRLLAVAA